MPHVHSTREVKPILLLLNINFIALKFGKKRIDFFHICSLFVRKIIYTGPADGGATYASAMHTAKRSSATPVAVRPLPDVLPQKPNAHGP